MPPYAVKKGRKGYDNVIKSMTGYGSGKSSAGGKTFSVEIKSVNYRYSDFSVKIPRIYAFLEDYLRKMCAARINRGKVDIYVNVETEDDACGSVHLNTALAKSYYEALKTLSAELDTQMCVSAQTFLKIPDVFTVEKSEDDEEEIKACAGTALGAALEEFEKMRLAEGEKLCSDLSEHLDFIQKATEDVERRSPAIAEEYAERLEERIKEILGSARYDETRLLTECALFADKINVNEEIVRLKSHIEQFRDMLSSNEPVGRKIDFLIQEMNREINTIGSKSNDLEVARIVIDVKAEIEKLREQIQNVE